MSIDLSEFHDVFFEECFEGLDVMETGLLKLDHTTEVEEINTIFRAAHSIKGGSASFGFMEISSFTHVMETLLDEMRDGRRAIVREVIDLLLSSVDVLRGMVNAARDEKENDSQSISDVQQKLEAMLADQGGAKAAESCVEDQAAANDARSSAESVNAAETVCNSNEWQITFRPSSSLIRQGFDPLPIFRDVRAYGDVAVTVDSAAIPPIQEINPESSYLQWTLQLKANIEQSVIESLFSQVDADSDIEIVKLGAEPAPPNKTPQDEPDASFEHDQQTPTMVDSSPTQNKSSTQTEQNTATPQRAAVSASGGSSGKDAGSIRVSIDKVDELINLVGELVITQSMLSQTGDVLVNDQRQCLEKLRDGLVQLERNTRDLQESVLQMRMLPISFSFNRFPRLVRDLSKKVGKQVDLTMTGENTEVDKTVLEKIGDPLVHLVRNALDHGIETPGVRKAAGKPETGTLELAAYHEGGDIIIKVIDDGAGLNRDSILNKAIEKELIDENDELSDDNVYNLIFAPGFSTAEQVSDISGRGVGMDVVRRNVRDLGGNVSIKSNSGHGSTVTIRLPLTLAILDGQLVRIGNETYIVPLISIVESLQMQSEQINSITGEVELFQLRDEYIPIVRLNKLFNMGNGETDLLNGLLVVVESDGKRVGLFVDDLQGQQQVVIKSLETNFRQIQGVSGATILGDGTIALIMDVAGLIQRHFENCRRESSSIAAVA